MGKKPVNNLTFERMIFHYFFYPVRNNAPLGFESRYSGTGISNGVYLGGNFTMESQKFSIDFTTLVNWFKSIGLVM